MIMKRDNDTGYSGNQEITKGNLDWSELIKKKLEVIRIPGRFVRISPGCDVSWITGVTSGDIWVSMTSNDQKTSTLNDKFGLITAYITQFGKEFPNRDSR